MCSRCSEYGHKSSNCFVELTCKYCKGKKRTTHLSKDCRSKQNTCQGCKKPGHKEDMCPKALCMNCKETGHYEEKCPKVICLNCKEVGHARARCPKDSSKRKIIIHIFKISEFLPLVETSFNFLILDFVSLNNFYS